MKKNKLINYRNTLNLDTPISELTSKSEEINQELDQKLSNLPASIVPKESIGVFNTGTQVRSSDVVVTLEPQKQNYLVRQGSYKQKYVGGVATGNIIAVGMGIESYVADSWITINRVSMTPGSFESRHDFIVQANTGPERVSTVYRFRQDESNLVNTFQIVQKERVSILVFTGVTARSYSFSQVQDPNATLTLDEVAEDLTWESSRKIQIHVDSGAIDRVIWANKLRIAVKPATPHVGYTKAWKPHYIIGYVDGNTAFDFTASIYDNYSTTFEYNESTMEWKPFYVSWFFGAGTLNYKVDFSAI